MRSLSCKKIYECDWWNMYKSDNFVKQYLHEFFSNENLLREGSYEKINFENQFGYVQCKIEVPENLPEASANIPPIFNNINVGIDDIGPFMEEYDEKEKRLTQPRRMLI